MIPVPVLLIVLLATLAFLCNCLERAQDAQQASGGTSGGRSNERRRPPRP